MTVASIVKLLIDGRPWPSGIEGPQVYIVPFKKVRRNPWLTRWLRICNAYRRLTGNIESQVETEFSLERDGEPYRITQAVYTVMLGGFEFYPKNEIVDKHEYATFEIYAGTTKICETGEIPIKLDYDAAYLAKILR